MFRVNGLLSINRSVVIEYCELAASTWKTESARSGSYQRWVQGNENPTRRAFRNQLRKI